MKQNKLPQESELRYSLIACNKNRISVRLIEESEEKIEKLKNTTPSINSKNSNETVHQTSDLPGIVKSVKTGDQSCEQPSKTCQMYQFIWFSFSLIGIDHAFFRDIEKSSTISKLTRRSPRISEQLESQSVNNEQASTEKILSKKKRLQVLLIWFFHVIVIAYFACRTPSVPKKKRHLASCPRCLKERRTR